MVEVQFGIVALSLLRLDYLILTQLIKAVEDIDQAALFVNFLLDLRVY